MSTCFFMFYCSPVQKDKGKSDKVLLLESNQRQRQAHMTNNADMLVEELYDTIWSVQNGNININTRQEVQDRFNQYFDIVKYYKWDDVSEPVIRISDDGTLATVSVKKLTTARFGADAPISATLFAWTSSYRKVEDNWKIYQTTSTIEEYESADPLFYYKKGKALLDSGKHLESLEMTEKAFILNHKSKAIKLLHAETLMANGKIDEASEIYSNILKSGNSLDQELLDNIKEVKDYELLISLNEQNKQPLSRSTVVKELEEKAIIPEGIAVNENTGDIYLSSTYKRKIIRIKPDGTVEDFVSSKQDGLYSTLGMEVNETTNELWVISAAIHKYLPMLDGEEENLIKSKIYRYNLQDGTIMKVYSFDTDEPIAFNDLTISRSGDVFITESMTPAVYKIAADTDEIELFYQEETFNTFYNGLALSSDESTLFVARSNGIVRLDPDSGEFLDELHHADTISLQGIDGMSYYNGSLICHQTSTIGGIEMYQLSEDNSRVIGRHTLESWNDYFDQASTGEIYNGKYIYIANAQMRSAFDNGSLKPLSELKPHVILELNLPSGD